MSQAARSSLAGPARARAAPAGSARALAAWWRSRGDLQQDSVLAAVFTAAAFAPPLTGNGLALGELARHPLGVPGSVLALAMTVPLAVRRRWPALSLGVVAVAYAIFQLAGYVSSFATIGLIVALYSAGAHAVTRRRALAWALTAGYAALAIALALRNSPERPVDWFTFYLVLVFCWSAGSWMRSRAAAEASRRRQSVELAITDERARIARELHDVVTHHVTAMVVQADATQFVLDAAPDRAADGLGAISGTGRRALAELFEKGEPEPMAAGTQLAVYRVVQEALTNAMKHATGQPTVVEVRYGDDEITVEVSNDGPVLGSFTAGRGLTGLRERVSRGGGELHAAARADGGFTVRARLPRIPAQAEP